MLMKSLYISKFFNLQTLTHLQGIATVVRSSALKYVRRISNTKHLKSSANDIFVHFDLVIARFAHL